MIDYKNLLARYINHVDVEEGTPYLYQPSYFTDEEWAELNRLAWRPQAPQRDPEPAVQQTGKVTIELGIKSMDNTLVTLRLDNSHTGPWWLPTKMAEALLSQLADQNSAPGDDLADYEDASQRYAHLDQAVQHINTIQAELAPLGASVRADQALKELLNAQAEAVSAANKLTAAHEALRKVWPAA